MSDKRHLTATVDPDLYRYIKSKDNTSKFLNRIIREHKNGETVSEEILALRLDQIQTELETTENQRETLRSKKAELEEQLRRKRDRDESKIQEAVESLSPRVLNEGNPAVETWADKLDMGQDALIQAVEQRMDGI